MVLSLSLYPAAADSNAINATVRSTNIAMFLCPSDGGPFNEAGNNYRGNTGEGHHYAELPEHPDSGNGMFPEVGLTTPASVLDGLSHTAAFSERLRGSGGFGTSAERDIFGMPPEVVSADDALLACRVAARPGAEEYFASGQYWLWMGRERTLYSHTQPPNGRVPDCLYGGAFSSPGMATARSHHPGGVNVLMGDGAVRFVGEGIAIRTWRGLSTRNGGELVD